MNKFGIDSKVKKTLVRNVELKAKPLTRKQIAVLDMGCSPKAPETFHSSQKENELSQPSICSSEALANYLSDVKKCVPPSVPSEDVDKYQLDAKVTKKLNFHFNDRIYKNLIELNANVEEFKTRRDKKTTSAGSNKKDLEPNIEDFCQDDREDDIIPNIPVIKPKFKPLRKVENGQLHKLISSFEDL